MEEFINVWNLGQGVSMDDRRTTEILQKVRKDLKNDASARPSSIVRGRFWRTIYQMMSMTDPQHGVFYRHQFCFVRI